MTDTAPLSAPHRKNERIYLLPPVMHDGEYVVTWCDIDPTDGEGQQYVRADVHTQTVGEAVTSLTARVAELEADYNRLAGKWLAAVNRATQAEAERDAARREVVASVVRIAEANVTAFKAETERDALKVANADLDKVLTAVAETLGVPCDSDEILVAVELAAASQAREAGMREALERADRSISYPVSTQIRPEGYDVKADDDTVRFVAGIIRTALSPAQPAQGADPLVTAYDNGVDHAWGVAKPLVEALERIAKAETTTFDDDLQEDVYVAMDEDEMREIARAALAQARSAGLLTTETTEGGNG